MDPQIAQMLKDNISKAFHGTKCPDHENMAYTANDMVYEGIEDFVGKSWQDITLEFISDGHRSCTSFMTPQTIRYYLPAYMILLIDHFNGLELDVAAEYVIDLLIMPYELDIDLQRKQFLDSEIPQDEVLEILNPSDDSEMFDYHQKKFIELVEGLSDVQRSLIREFLEFIRDEYAYPEAEQALERYWAAF